MRLLGLVLSLLCISVNFVHAAEIIDVHVHMSGRAESSDPYHVQNLLDAMAGAGVSKAVVLSEGYAKRDDQRQEAEFENDYLAEQVKKHPGKLIGFCGVPFMASWAEEEIARCAGVLKLTGLKLHPQQVGLDLRDSQVFDRLESLFRAAEANKLPVLIDSMWMDSHVTGKVLRLSALKFPELKIILGHALFTHFRDLFFIASMYELAPQITRNLYVDISATLVFYADHPERDLLVWHLRKFGMDRVFFGSDYPALSPLQTLDALGKYPFSQEEAQKILSGNFEHFLRSGP